MGKKALLAIIITAVVLIGGGVTYAVVQNNKTKKNLESAEVMKKEDGSMEKTDDAMSKQGSYVTLADYNKYPNKYADSKKVYFFHASWCPICRGIDKEINADMSKIPAGVTLIKTDFDSSSDLRQKFGVTTQYSFVQVDNSGNEIAQWSATSLNKAIAGIKS